MGILLQAACRGTTGSVPTPADGHPGVPWWWDRLAAAAHDLRTSGFTAVLLPPVLKTSAGAAPHTDGYTVPHQRNGGNDFVYRYRDVDGSEGNVRFPKNPLCFVSNVPRDPVAGPVADDFPFGDELCPVNARPPGYVMDDLTEAGDWMTRDLDVQGYRVDDVKGPAVQFVDHWLTTKSMATRFAVGEYFEGDPRTLHWWVWDSGMKGRCAAFDFSLRFALAAMCANPSNWDMRQLDHAGLTGISPQQSVTFIENPDTDGSSPVVTNKLLAYAYLLTAEGYPCVFYRDYATDPGCCGLKPFLDNVLHARSDLHQHPTPGGSLMSTAITTRSCDNARTGSYTHETVLTASAVGTRGIRRAFSLQLSGDKRGVEGQPLAVPGVELDDGSVHDVIYLADMANQIWAFDAATGAKLWLRALGTPVNGGEDIDMYVINDHWGIMGTPVIDTATGILYAVAWVSDHGSVASARHWCFAVSIRNGRDAHPPADLEGVTFDAGHGAPVQRFSSAARKQRAGLLLTKVDGIATVFISFGSVRETGKDARGWVIACGTDPFGPTAAWAATAKGFGGGIWHGAGGLAADPAGHVYAMTGNGSFDGVTDFAESFVKLAYTPPGAGAEAALELVDWWTPFTDDARVAGTAEAQDAADEDDPAAPEAAAAPAPTNFRAVAASAGMEGWSDMDLASGGPVVVPSHNAVLGAGKDGVLYVVKLDDMGRTTPADLAAPADNYAKLLSPPIFFTYFSPTLSPHPDDIRTLNTLWDNVTHHLHGNPVVWNSVDRGPLVYCWGENGNLRAWSLNPDGSLTYLACSAESASPQAPVPSGGMPGGMISLSADPTAPHTGVVWATVPYIDANQKISAGRLLAYDATTFDTFADGSKKMRLLWDSQAWNLQFSYNKFNRPVVFRGRLYVPTYDDRVDVYELA